jgi:hypothetical protein
MATIIVTPNAPAEIRVSRPSSRNKPPKNSTPDTNGVRMCGNGIPHDTKFSVMAGKLLSFPQPLHRNTQPTTMRAKRGASHSMCRAVRSGQPIKQLINVFMWYPDLMNSIRIRPERG